METKTRLARLIEAGSIFIDGSEYVGLASDGVEVSIGNMGDETQIEQYLEAHPTPDTW